MKTAAVIRHIHFEDLGVFADVLATAGYDVRYHDVGGAGLNAPDALAPDLVVVLGGPVGAYETDVYPFLAVEQRLLRQRLAAGRPTLGICLGAQLMAAALGAAVAPTGRKEVGFSALTLTDAGSKGPLRHLADVPVLHWHGDAFQIPEGAVHLAATDICATQAFAIGRNILGLQFHPEADAVTGIEPWLVGHAIELASAGIDPRGLRGDAARFGPRLRDAAQSMIKEWLEGLS